MHSRERASPSKPFPAPYQTEMVDVVRYPEDLATPAQLPNLAPALMGRGYTPDDITKILGGNFLRLFREVW